MKVLVTGAAGFIGFHLVRRLLDTGCDVTGLDHLNAYYDLALKQARLSILQGNERFAFYPFDLSDTASVEQMMSAREIDTVVHLAAQPGVRHSLTHPEAYVHSNLLGFAALLELCRKLGVRHFYYASSSSVYGKGTPVPFTEGDRTDRPSNLYAATKKSNELLAYAYSESFGMPTTGLRFFSVYGPWGRPDMAYFSFTRDILNGRPIAVHNGGRMRRDFTYVDDIVESLVRLLDAPECRLTAGAGAEDVMSPEIPYRIFNIGGGNPVELTDFIRILENLLGRRAILEMKPMQPGENLETYADAGALEAAAGYRPHTPLEQGLKSFVRWYRNYYGV